MFLLAKKTNYAELVNLCAVCPVMCKIMCVYNRIIPLAVDETNTGNMPTLSDYRTCAAEFDICKNLT